VHERFAQRRSGVAAERRRRRVRRAVQGTSAVALVAAAIWAAYSPLTTIQDVQVSGLHRLEPHKLAGDLPIQPGVQLHHTLRETGAAQLAEHPAIAEVTVSRPDAVTLRYEVSEHPADYVLRAAGGEQERVVTATGYVIADQRTPADRKLPVVTVAGQLPAVASELDAAGRAAIDLHRQLPAAVAEETVAIEAADPADTRLQLDTGVEVHVGDVELIGAKMAGFAAVADDLERRGEVGAVVDVRVPDMPTVRAPG